MNDYDPEDILEHFGVKGMRWGVRKDSKRSADRDNKKMSPKAKKILIGATAAAGASAAGILLYKNGNIKIPNNVSRQKIKDPKLPISQIPKTKPVTFKPGQTTHTQHKAILDKLIKDHNETIRKSNEMLKEGYDRHSVPLPSREYLKSW